MGPRGKTAPRHTQLAKKKGLRTPPECGRDNEDKKKLTSRFFAYEKGFARVLKKKYQVVIVAAVFYPPSTLCGRKNLQDQKLRPGDKTLRNIASNCEEVKGATASLAKMTFVFLFACHLR